LGDCFAKGEGTELDIECAVEYYKKAADKGNAMGQYHYGFCVSRGFGVEANYHVGMHLLHQSAAHGGLAMAQMALADNYYEGIGGKEPDYSEALRWYRQAANQNYVDAVYKLGTIYYTGRGATVNPREAAVFFRKGAELGHEGCQAMLEKCNEASSRQSRQKPRSESTSSTKSP
jgi:hypothetical protein